MTAETPREPPWLGRLCLWLACGLLTAWAADRVKPVFWYGPMFGVVLGGLAIGLRAWFAATPRRIDGLEVALLAMAGVSASLWIAAERVRDAGPQRSGKDAVAEALIAQLEQMPVEGSHPPQPTKAFAGTTTAPVIDRWNQLIARRYQLRPELGPAAWVSWELLAAGAVAGVISQWAWLSRSQISTVERQESSS